MSTLCCDSFSTLDYNSLQTINGGDTKTGLELIGVTAGIVIAIAVAAPVATTVAAGAALAVGVVAAATCLSVGICELFGHDL